MDSEKPREIRIGNAERTTALEALGEHYTIGRLDNAEYSERVDAVTAARTRSELSELFIDLPEPTPFGPGDGSAALTPAARAASAPARIPDRREKVVRTLNLFAGGGTVLVFLLLLALGVPMAWLVFILLPMAYGAIRIWAGPGDVDASGIDSAEQQRRRDVESRRRKELGY
ncbi:uncharacterized protein DUF1707 [Williamsia limnetica]|jgi:hypothetical protein|uniref:Uncharacterized protein DUF1707 n=1 Tax=Williamsia limnetica TaxID=882452 RepID=A0A318S457_WILLI|nr:DUF1707 domain-containing protein [Williamsia limnetica]PYE18675.1 uncharacterized protein DUF1707 [Williamsia limnetica]